MAADTDPNGDDLPAHAASYTGFIWWLKTGTAITAVVTFIVVLLISQ